MDSFLHYRLQHLIMNVFNDHHNWLGPIICTYEPLLSFNSIVEQTGPKILKRVTLQRISANAVFRLT